MEELSKFHERALICLPLEMATQDITSLLKRSEKRLMELASNVPSEDSNVRKNVQVRTLVAII
jgi:hypothetical protein